MARVKFLPSNIEVELVEGEDLYHLAHAAGVPMASMCGGLGSCTGCRIKILEGEEFLSPMGYKEKERLGNTYFITKERLACQTRATGPVVVEVLLEEQRDKRDRARKRAYDRTLENAQRRNQRQAETGRTGAENRRGQSEPTEQGGRTPPEPGRAEGSAERKSRRRSPQPKTSQAGEIGRARAAASPINSGGPRQLTPAVGETMEQASAHRQAGPGHPPPGRAVHISNPEQVPEQDGDTRSLPEGEPSTPSARHRRRRGGRGRGR